MKSTSTLAIALIFSLAGAPLMASASGDHAGSHAGHSAPATTTAQAATGPAASDTASSAASSDAKTEGEIKKVDKEAGKLTIKHAELKNLDMPAMTMVFQVKDKAMLDQVKTGDKVTFVAEKVDGKFTVTQLDAKK